MYAYVGVGVRSGIKFKAYSFVYVLANGVIVKEYGQIKKIEQW